MLDSESYEKNRQAQNSLAKKNKELTQEEALEELKKMDKETFNKFLNSLPLRVQWLVKARFVDWKEVLPEWFIKSVNNWDSIYQEEV